MTARQTKLWLHHVVVVVVGVVVVVEPVVVVEFWVLIDDHSRRLYNIERRWRMLHACTKTTCSEDRKKRVVITWCLGCGLCGYPTLLASNR